MIKTLIKPPLLILLGLMCFSANGQWQLVEAQSSVNFVTTKNQHISEVLQFKKLSGKFDLEGELTIAIDLASIDSGIAIRDSRMREKLFMLDKFPKAKLTAQLPKTVLKLKKGQAVLVSVPAQLRMNNHTKEITVSVQVTRTANNAVVATSAAPILIKASDFGLAAGIDVLQKLAGLSSIGKTVPVNFTLLFAPH